MLASGAKRSVRAVVGGESSAGAGGIEGVDGGEVSRTERLMRRVVRATVVLVFGGVLADRWSKARVRIYDDATVRSVRFRMGGSM
jgi:hypothetical protein